jgi:hypothetical protein
MIVVSGTEDAGLSGLEYVRLTEVGQPQLRMRVAVVKAGKWRANEGQMAMLP